MKEIFTEYKKFYPQGLLTVPMLRLLLDPVDVYEPSFKATEQITKKFIDMEEENLKLIRDNQDSENEKDDLNHKLKEMEDKYEEEIRNLKFKKADLEKKIEDKRSRMIELDRDKMDNSKEIRIESTTLFDQIKLACKIVEVPKDMPAVELMTVSLGNQRNLSDG